MNPNWKRKWTDALRSGEYEQGQFYLKRNDKYCCLGVLCDIIDHNQWEYKHDGSYKYDGSDGGLTQSVRFVVGMSEDDVNHLVFMNDSVGAKFPEIADYIETNL